MADLIVGLALIILLGPIFVLAYTLIDTPSMTRRAKKRFKRTPKTLASDGFAPLGTSKLSKTERSQLLMDWWEQNFEEAVGAVEARERCFELQRQMRESSFPYSYHMEAEQALREWQTLMHRHDTPVRYKYAKMGYGHMDRETYRTLPNRAE